MSGVQAQLSLADERNALIWLTEKFKQRFGHSPISFRAGRYGLGENSVDLLRDLGYRVDSSVTPGLCSRYYLGGRSVVCDYREAAHSPYECARADPAHRGDCGIIEIPISVYKPRMNPYEALRLFCGRKRRFVWLRPGFSSRKEMVNVVQRVAHRNDPYDLLVMMFHNTELAPGKSPYSATRREVKENLSYIREFINVALQYELTPVTYREYIEAIFCEESA